MPNRFIKESITTSETIAQLNAAEEVLFYRLIVVCDDYGRYDARPEILRAKCYPLSIDKVKVKHIEEWVTALVNAGLAIIYTHEGRPYLQLASWEKHQQIRASKSKFPSLDDDGSQIISGDINCYQKLADVYTYNEYRTTDNVKEDKGSGEKGKPEKVAYADNVSMTEDEHQKLVDKFGLEDADRMIEILDAYKGSKNKKYANDYKAILSWVVKALEEEKARGPGVVGGGKLVGIGGGNGRNKRNSGTNTGGLGSSGRYTPPAPREAFTHTGVVEDW